MAHANQIRLHIPKRVKRATKPNKMANTYASTQKRFIESYKMRQGSCFSLSAAAGSWWLFWNKGMTQFRPPSAYSNIHCCWPHYFVTRRKLTNNSRAQDHKVHYVLLFDMEVDSASGSPEKSSSGWTCVGNSRITSAHDCGFFMSFFDDLKCVCKQLYIITWLEARGTEPHFSPNYNSLLSYITHKMSAHWPQNEKIKFTNCDLWKTLPLDTCSRKTAR